MTVGADLRIGIKIVQQDKFRCQLVMVWCDSLGEQAQSGITISLQHVAEYLVVGAILFDNVKHIFDWAGLPGSAWNRAILRRPYRAVRRRGQGAETINFSRMWLEKTFQAGAARQINNAERTPEQMSDVFYSEIGIAVDAGLGTVRVGARAETLAISNQQMPAVGRDAYRGGIPPDRNKAERTAFAAPAQIKHGNNVIISICDEERLFIGRKR